MDWLKEIDNSKYRRQMLVGRARKLYNEGKNAVEIAAILSIPESGARNLVKMFETNDRVNAKKKMDIPKD